ncbi:MAG: O-antigen ligase family protein [Sphingomonas sp.]|nr:O-antigen ligase family protein [Sphingomonas sp.]
MREALSPFDRSRAVSGLFAIGLVTIPFDSVHGVSALGELGSELSFPFFAAAIALALWTEARGGDSRILSSLSLRVAAAALAIILLSFAVNLPDIAAIVFRERTGSNKFVTSLLVVLYGFALAWLAEQVDSRRILPLVARFIGWSAAIASAYLVVEFAGKHGLLGGAFDTIDGIIHTRQADVINAWNGRVNEKVLYGWDARLRSVSFEPPAFGNYTGLAWPWVWFAAIKAPPERRLRAWCLFAIFTTAILLSASRTGLLLLASNVAVMAVLAALYARRSADGEAAAAARLLVPVASLVLAAVAAVWAAGRYQGIVVGLMEGDSVSNISRFGFQVAGFNMFVGHPLLGVGLGQFGFHVVEYLPNWIYRSPEITPMITYPTAPWPNVYSLYARLGAELGLFGLLGWVLLWVGLAAKLGARARRDASDGAARISLHYPIILNCMGVLVSGIATDTYRTPMIWIALGLGCGVLARSAAPASVAGEPSPRLVPPRFPQ